MDNLENDLIEITDESINGFIIIFLIISFSRLKLLKRSP